MADHISSRELNFLTTSQKCSPQLPFHQAQIEELALLYRFMPSIPRETFKTHKTRPSVVSFAQLYKFKLVSFAPLSPDDGSARQLPQIRITRDASRARGYTELPDIPYSEEKRQFGFEKLRERDRQEHAQSQKILVMKTQYTPEKTEAEG